MTKPDHDRRETDKSAVSRFVDNSWAKLVHQIITFVAPFIVVGASWIFVTVFNSYSLKLDMNTQAINSLAAVVGSANAEFRQEFNDHDHRLTRLEASADKWEPRR